MCDVLCHLAINTYTLEATTFTITNISRSSEPTCTEGVGRPISCMHILADDLPCFLVPSSRGRLLVIPMTVSLQASRSLVSAHSSVSVQFVMALMSSSHRARGLPLFLAPPPIPNIIDFSKLFSLRMMCPKYDSCCFFICASSGLVGLISSITDLLVLLAVHGILSSLLQHHNSKLSILLLSAFLIVQDSQPYRLMIAEPLTWCLVVQKQLH